MDIHREGRYFVGTDLKKRLLFGIQSSKLAECVVEAKRRKAYGVFGNPGFGFREDNLNFLAKLPNIGSLWFWDVLLKDIDGIYALKKLQSFGVHPKRPGIDFSRLSHLRDVFLHYNKEDHGLGALKKLQTYGLWHYHPKHRSFEGLEIPNTIEELDIGWANPSDLKGLPVLPRLTRFRVLRCRNLASLKELLRIAPNIEHMVVTGCGRITDGASVVKHLPNLRHAWVHDALLVSR